MACASYAYSPLNFSLSCSIPIEKDGTPQGTMEFRMKAKEAEVKEKIFTGKSQTVC